jgi:hypothetical protein
LVRIVAVFFGGIERASIDQMTSPPSGPSPEARKPWLAGASPAMMRNKWLDMLTMSSQRVDWWCFVPHADMLFTKLMIAT